MRLAAQTFGEARCVNVLHENFDGGGSVQTGESWSAGWDAVKLIDSTQAARLYWVTWWTNRDKVLIIFVDLPFNIRAVKTKCSLGVLPKPDPTDARPHLSVSVSAGLQEANVVGN